MARTQLKTVKDAAEIVGLTEARIRQICQAHEIGTKIGRDRLLTAADVRRIRSIPDGRTKKARPKSQS